MQTQSIQPTGLFMEESKKGSVGMGNVTEEPNCPLCTGPRSCCLHITLWRGEEGQRCTSSPIRCTDCQPSYLAHQGIPMPSSALNQNRTDFQGSVAVSDTLTIHILKNRNAVNWKREGLAHGAEPPQFTQLSKCQDIYSLGYHMA